MATLVIAILSLREEFTDRPTAWAVRLGLFLPLGGMAIGFLIVGPTPSSAPPDR